MRQITHFRLIHAVATKLRTDMKRHIILKPIPLNSSAHIKSIKRLFSLTTLLLTSSFLSACYTAPMIQNATGVSAMTVDSSRTGPVSGVGIEGQDIVSMTDKMMRDMLANQRLATLMAKLPGPPIVVLEGNDFENRSSQVIDKNSIANRLRINLNNAANGRMEFVNRQSTARIAQARALKRSGSTSLGTTGLTKAIEGEDWFMAGQIVTADARSTKTGLVQRYSQITFEMTDAESGRIIWSGLYEFTRAAADDVIYR